MKNRSDLTEEETFMDEVKHLNSMLAQDVLYILKLVNCGHVSVQLHDLCFSLMIE